METPVFALFCLAVGYLMYWTVMNEKRDPDGGSEGWFAIRPPRPNRETAKDPRDGRSPDARRGS